jgi:hypothetical protein
MSFIPNSNTNFIQIKLTDSGRRQLSLGQLAFTTAIFSDREIDYSVGRGTSFNILNSRVISPKDANPFFGINFDGSSGVPLLSSQVSSSRQISTASTTTAGFFTGTTNSWAIDQTQYKGVATISYSGASINGGNVLTADTGGYTATTGDIVYIPWSPIQNSGLTYSNNTLVLSGNPTVANWYSISAVTLGTKIALTLDRALPNFGHLPTTYTQKINAYFYPGGDAIANYYGSAVTISPHVWNMAIVRTNTVEGGLYSQSGFTTYGSVQYAGAKHFLSFSSDTKAIGILSYSNESSANTYSEQFIENSVVLNFPNIMWHGNNFSDNGTGIAYGVTGYDAYGSSTYFDVSAQTTFRYLMDGIGSTSNIIGRVYHKLKMIVITDQELLAALTYKSNRNYTLPPLNVSLVGNPKYPLTTANATGLCNSGYTYFVTYIPESTNQYLSGVSYGYSESLHCSYIQQIDGANDLNGNPQFLNVSFPSNPFPYMRNSANMTTLSGTGWNANSVQILVNQQPTGLYNKGNVPETGWQRISNKNSGGNGIYSANTLTIDPIQLAGYNFVISQQDYNSGSTYYLNSMFTGGTDVMYFGNENFLFANLDVNILSTTYKTSIVAMAKNDALNSSLNDTYDDTQDTNTYITAVGVLDNQNNLVAVGKPTYPIPKNIGRFITVQLEIDF